MASALFKLVKIPEALTTASAGLKLDPSNQALGALLEKIKAKKAEQDTIEARKREGQERLMRERHALGQALKKRGIKYRKSPGGRAPDLPEDAVMQLEGDKQSPDSTLVFPVMVLYPLHMQSDFIQAFQETHTLAQHLEYLLPPPWDVSSAYVTGNVEAYMETTEGGLVKWGKNVELGKLLGGGKVEVLDGILRVTIVQKTRASEWIESLRKKKTKGNS
jgi:Cns1/TTC4 Wheel domain